MRFKRLFPSDGRVICRDQLKRPCDVWTRDYKSSKPCCASSVDCIGHREQVGDMVKLEDNLVENEQFFLVTNNFEQMSTLNHVNLPPLGSLLPSITAHNKHK